MRYCTKCATEYRDDIATCTDCGAALVGPDAWEQVRRAREHESAEEFIPVKTVDDQFAAEVIRDALEKDGIPVMVRSFSDTSFDGIFIPQKGWGMILVPGEFRTQAENLINLLD